MTNEDFVSYKIAQALSRCGYDGQYDYMYATEAFCFGNNPNSFETICVGEKISEFEAYYVNDDNEDAYRGIPCPTLWEAQKWLRKKKRWYIEVRINGCRNMFCVELWEMKPNGHYKILEQTDGHVQLFDRYEDALSDGIYETLKLIEEGEE